MHILFLLADKHAALTTNHPTSAYGRPVLVVDGEAFGPNDFLAWQGRYVTAASLALAASADTTDTTATAAACRQALRAFAAAARPTFSFRLNL